MEKEEQLKQIQFKEELTLLLNRYSKENGSNTPDFILTDYLIGCLDNFNKASRNREKWYGKELSVYNKTNLEEK